MIMIMHGRLRLHRQSRVCSSFGVLCLQPFDLGLPLPQGLSLQDQRRNLVSEALEDRSRYHLGHCRHRLR
jgi:hypothetical protein